MTSKTNKTQYGLKKKTIENNNFACVFKIGIYESVQMMVHGICVQVGCCCYQGYNGLLQQENVSSIRDAERCSWFVKQGGE